MFIFWFHWRSRVVARRGAIRDVPSSDPEMLAGVSQIFGKGESGYEGGPSWSRLRLRRSCLLAAGDVGDVGTRSVLNRLLGFPREQPDAKPNAEPSACDRLWGMISCGSMQSYGIMELRRTSSQLCCAVLQTRNLTPILAANACASGSTAHAKRAYTNSGATLNSSVLRLCRSRPYSLVGVRK